MFKELSRNVFHCSVIMVLCLATAFIVYHFVFALSRIFLPDFQKVFFKPFCFSLSHPLSATTRLVYHYVFCLSTCFLTLFLYPGVFVIQRRILPDRMTPPALPVHRVIRLPGKFLALVIQIHHMLWDLICFQRQLYNRLGALFGPDGVLTGHGLFPSHVRLHPSGMYA